MFPPLLYLVLLFGLLLCFPLGVFPLPVLALKERLDFWEQDAGKVGKIKTVMQCVAVMLILIGMPLQGTSPLAFLLTAGRVALWISVALSIWSAVEYIVKNKGAVTSM